MRPEVVNVGEGLGVISTARQAGDTVKATGGAYSLPAWRRRSPTKGPGRHEDQAKDVADTLKWFRLAQYALNFSSERRHNHYLHKAAIHYNLLDGRTSDMCAQRILTMRKTEHGRISKAIRWESAWREKEEKKRETFRQHELEMKQADPYYTMEKPGPKAPRREVYALMVAAGLVPPWPGPSRRIAKHHGKAVRTEARQSMERASMMLTRSGFSRIVGDEKMMRVAR